MISEECVINGFKRIKDNKSPGPDNISGKTLKYCAEQLGPIFQRLFQKSFDSCVIPDIWKTSVVIPVPKKTNPCILNDYRPVALTSLIMKTFEKSIKACILLGTEEKMDPLQFAYRKNRGVDDAKIFILDKLYKHLDISGNHARILFADFSSAFNTMQPHILADKLLNNFDLDHRLVLWVINFLTKRSQKVLVNNKYSDLRITYVGSPQGCVLSPILYILYTDDCRSKHANHFLVKYADDSALLSLLNSQDNGHGHALCDFVEWCNNSFLKLNANKTKDMLFDFRRNSDNQLNSVISNECIEIVSDYKYLGTFFSNKLDWDKNTESIIKKAQQRVFFLRKLNSFSAHKNTLTLFYRSYIESILCFSCICWFNNLNLKQKNSMSSIVNLCSKIIGEQQRCLPGFYNSLILNKAKSIIADQSHALFCEFDVLPSGRRYRSVHGRTKRYIESFVPSVIRLLNKSSSSNGSI